MVTFCPVSSIKRVSKVGDWTQMADIFHLSLNGHGGYLWSFVKRAPDNDFNLLLNDKLSIKSDTLYSMSDIKYGQNLLRGRLSRDHLQLFQHMMRVQKIQNCNRYGAICVFKVKDICFIVPV